MGVRSDIEEMLPDPPVDGKSTANGHDLDEVEVVVVAQRRLAVLFLLVPVLDVEAVEIARG